MADLNQLLQSVDSVPTVPTGGVQVVNPLAAITAGNQAAQQEFQTREWQAKQAAGQAYQGAINPQTGEFNPNKFRTLLSQSGPAALAAGVALQNTQNISSDQFNQAKAKTAWANTAAGSLTRLGPNITQQDAINALHDGVTSGMLTQAEFDRQSAQVAALGNDPAKLHAWASQHQFNAMSTQQQLEQTYGTPFREDRGGQIVGGTQAPARMGGGLSTGPGAIDTGMTPAQRGAIVTWDASDGTKHTGTVEEMHKDLGIPTPSGPAVGGAGGGAPQPPTGGGKSIPGPGPGTVKAAELSAEDSAKAGAALRSRAEQVPNNKANYANMKDDIATLSSMGPGTEKEAYLNSLVQKWTGKTWGTMTPDQIRAANSFAKLSNIAVGQQLAQMGGTDERQRLFMGSNPHLDLSKLSNDYLTGMLQGNEDAVNAKYNAWEDWKAAGNGDHTYSKFQRDFNSHYDPRVFQQKYMKAGSPELTMMMKNMLNPDGTPTKDGEKFKADVLYARQHKWIE